MSEETNENSVEVATPTTINDLKPKMKLTGTVKQLELYGAFIDIGVGVNALIHISKLSKERVNRVSDMLTEGEEVTVWVEKVNSDTQQIMLTMLEPLAVEWGDLKTGQVYTGRVNRLENFGTFVDIGAEREGLVHISELSHGYVKHPSELYTAGDEVQVQVLGFSKRKRRIDLSIKSLLDEPEPAESSSYSGGQRGGQQESYAFEDEDEFEEETMPTAMEIAMRRAMGEPVPSVLRERKRKKRKSRAKVRAQQEDIMDRTLRTRHEG